MKELRVEGLFMWNDEEMLFKVVKNHEDQYSIWPADRENPLGWSDVGFSGVKKDCLDHINKTWTDMRPRSLREKMAAAS